jgi:RNA 2',3'-cyclic 3'-phosphodiesterase
LRLFAALELPEDVVAALERWGRACERPGLRVLPRASLHVTLAFLGARPDEEAEAIGAAVTACAAPVGGLAVGEVAWLGRGTALAIDLVDGDGACGRLQACVSDALEALGAYEPEQRAFRPHVTVARVRKGSRVRRAVPDPPALGPFGGAALTVFESHLSPKGARYSPMARADLPR